VYHDLDWHFGFRRQNQQRQQETLAERFSNTLPVHAQFAYRLIASQPVILDTSLTYHAAPPCKDTSPPSLDPAELFLQLIWFTPYEPTFRK